MSINIEFYKGPMLASQTAYTADMAFILASDLFLPALTAYENPTTQGVGPTIAVTISPIVPY